MTKKKTEQRTPDEVRPRLPWLSRIGTKNGELNQLGMMLRGVAALLVIVNPVAALVMWVTLLSLSRTRVKGRWLTLGGGAVTLVALLTGWVVRYNTVWRELAQAVKQAIRERDSAVLSSALSDWPIWLAWQVPVGIALGVCVAGLVLSYRAQYKAAWRTNDDPPATPRAIDKASRRLDAATRPAAFRADDVVIPLGIDQDTAKPFEVSGAALRMHGVVAGPTGFGKTTTLERLVYGLVGNESARSARTGITMVDMKGDVALAAYLEQVAKAAGRPFVLLTERTGRYNPLRHGDAAQLKDRLIETEANSSDGGFSEPHYRRLGERYVLLCVTVLLDLVDQGAVSRLDDQRRPWRRDLPDLVRIMRPGALRKEADRLSPQVAAQVSRYLDEMKANKNLVSDTYGVYSRFALVCDGPAGQILTDTGTADVLDVEAAIREGAIVCASLDAASDGATSRILGNLLIQDITSAFGVLKAEQFGTEAGRMMSVIVDEFSALGGSLLVNLYARGRQAGASVILASQDLDGDLTAVSPAFRTQVITNANLVILHQQRGDAPDIWAKWIGTREVWKETVQTTADMSVLGAQEAATGLGTVRQTHSFIVTPDTLRKLKRGEAVVFVGHPERRVARVQITPPPQLTTGRELPKPQPRPAPDTPASPTANPWITASVAVPQTIGEPEQYDDEPPVVEPVD